MAKASIWAQPAQTDAQPVMDPGVFASIGGAANLPEMPDSPAPAIAKIPTPLETLVARDSGRLQQLEKPPTPWAQLSTGHKIGRVFADIGNAAGDVFAPSRMALIPGTQLHKESEEAALAKRLPEEEKEASAESEEPYKENLERAQTENLEHPPAQALPTSSGYESYNPRTGETEPIKGEVGEPLMPYVKPGPRQHVFLQGAGGQSVAATFDPQSGTYYDAHDNPIANPQPYEKPENQTPHPGTSQGKNAYGFYTPGKGWADANGNALPDFQPFPNYAQLGLYEPTLTVNSQGQLEPGTFNRRTGTTTAQQGNGPTTLPGNVATEVNRSLETARGADTRLRVMMDNEADALKGDQQAMLSLLANHLGMTMGLQKGARMNQALIEEAEQSRPWMQGIKAQFDQNGYLTGVKLSPEQIHQMIALAKDRRDREWQQAQETGQNYGVQVQIPQLTEPRANVANSGGADIVYDGNGVAHRYKGTGSRNDPANYEAVKK